MQLFAMILLQFAPFCRYKAPPFLDAALEKQEMGFNFHLYLFGTPYAPL